MDASTKTPGGRCLNDLVVKGVVSSLNLVRMVLRHAIGKHAVAGDLSQFYNSLKLKEEFYNLQRFLYRQNLGVDEEVLEGIIVTLMYGVKSVSAQSEEAMLQLAKDFEKQFPALAKLIREGRYVDDMGDSKALKAEIVQLIKDAEEVFAKVGIICKAWTENGGKPEEKVAGENAYIGIGGLHWYPEIDQVSVPIPPLHFGTVKRGRLESNVELFKGNFGDLEQFVPKNLTLRQVVSKVASIFDIRGLLAPIIGSLRLDTRITCKLVMGWDDPMPDHMRSKWIKNFWCLEELRGVSYTRALMPEDAANSRARAIVLVDAALEILMMAVYICFELVGGGWSCQLLISRPALADSDSTIPKNELQALCSGSNLGWTVMKSLEDWVVSKIVCSDSTIALCWAMSEGKPLSMFHKNRVIQIKRGTNVEDLYHVRTEVNAADIGTRPEKISPKDVMPGSVFHQGYPWMRMDISEAEEDGYITHVSKLKLKPEEEDDFKQGLLFDKVPDILTHGHQVSAVRVDKMTERATVADYLIQPTKHSFPTMVRIYSMVFSFVTKCRKNAKILSVLLMEGKLSFQLFKASSLEETEQPRLYGEKPFPPNIAMVVDTEGKGPQGISLVSNYSPQPIFELMAKKSLDGSEWKTTAARENWKDCYSTMQMDRGGLGAVPTDRYLNQALLYLYRKGTKEVKAFNKPKEIKRLGFEVEGVLLSKDRLVQGMDFMETAELDLNLGAMGIRTSLPLLDRYSPLSYSIAQHVHWDLGKHRGPESCSRLSLEQVHIMQGAGLYRELGEQCIRCKIKRKKYLEAAFGPLKETQLALAPPMYFCQMDLFGPIRLYVPGKERETRATKAQPAVQGHVMVFVCPTTRLINIQVIETSKPCDIISGVIRLSCEIGAPRKMYIDRSNAETFGLTNVDYDLRGLQLQLTRQRGIDFELCPVSGHNAHGHVERVIRSVQESLDDAGFQTKRYTATALSTLCKLVENSYNALPLGYHQHERAGGTPLLKIITPNHLKMGRINNRVLDGPMRLPKNKEEYLKNAREMYDAWFAIWRDAYVPQLLYQPKWFDSSRDLLPGDLVYFIKEESALKNKWIVGMVDEAQKGRDGVLREITVRYCNASEQRLTLEGNSANDSTLSRYTVRAVRKIVKIFSLEDADLGDDIKEFLAKMKEMPKGYMDDEGMLQEVNLCTVEPEECGRNSDDLPRCCCQEHCRVNFHQSSNLLKKVMIWDEPEYKVVECTSLEEATYEGSDSDVGNMEAGWGWNMDVDDLLNIV